MISNHAPSATRSPLQELGTLPIWGAPGTASFAGFGLLVHVPGQRNKNLGGESGIRTHGGRKPTPDFESGSFGHSDTSPRRKLAASPVTVKPEIREKMPPDQRRAFEQGAQRNQANCAEKPGSEIRPRAVKLSV